MCARTEALGAMRKLLDMKPRIFYKLQKMTRQEQLIACRGAGVELQGSIENLTDRELKKIDDAVKRWSKWSREIVA